MGTNKNNGKKLKLNRATVANLGGAAGGTWTALARTATRAAKAIGKQSMQHCKGLLKIPNHTHHCKNK